MHPSSVCSNGRCSQGGQSHKQCLFCPDRPATLLWANIQVRLEKLSWVGSLKVRVCFHSSLKPSYPTKHDQQVAKGRHFSLFHPFSLLRSAQGQIIALLVRPCLQNSRKRVCETRRVAPVETSLSPARPSFTVTLVVVHYTLGEIWAAGGHDVK